MLFSLIFSCFLLIPQAVLFEEKFRDGNQDYKIRITDESSYKKISLYKKSDSTWQKVDFLTFKKPLYNFKVIDLNHDGVQDFCFGIVKTTRWNTEPMPKLHLYSHKNGKIYPIWRSSKIGQNLVDFNVDYSENTTGLKILDNPKPNSYNIALYRWNSFGLKFVRYLYIDLDSAKSIKLLKGEK